MLLKRVGIYEKYGANGWSLTHVIKDTISPVLPADRYVFDLPKVNSYDIIKTKYDDNHDILYRILYDRIMVEVIVCFVRIFPSIKVMNPIKRKQNILLRKYG